MSETTPLPDGAHGRGSGLSVRRYIGLLVSGALLALLLWHMVGAVDWALLTRRLLQADPVWLAAAAVCLLLNYPLNSFRFWLVSGWVSGKSPPYAATVEVTWLACFIAVSAPFGALGDLARVGLAQLRLGMSLGYAAQAVLFDRGLGMLSYIVLALLASIRQFKETLPGHFLLYQISVLCGSLIVLALVLGGYRLIPWPSTRLGQFISVTLGDISKIIRRPRWVGLQLLVALGNVATYTGGMLCIAKALGFEFNALNLVLFAPLMLIVMNLPIFYQGWGGREATILLLLEALAPTAGSDAVLAASFVYGGLAMLTALPGAIYLPAVSVAAASRMKNEE